MIAFEGLCVLYINPQLHIVNTFCKKHLFLVLVIVLSSNELLFLSAYKIRKSKSLLGNSYVFNALQVKVSSVDQKNEKVSNINLYYFSSALVNYTLRVKFRDILMLFYHY